MIQATATGNIGKDAEIKTIGEKQYSVFRMGVSGKGNIWVQVAVPYREGKLHPYLSKGAKILVVGTPSTSAYIDKEGKAISGMTIWANSTELLGSKKEAQQSAGSSYAAPTAPQQVSAPVEKDPDIDDLPF